MKDITRQLFFFTSLDQSKAIHTELSLVPEEFESYQVGVDNEVTFCLKELRVSEYLYVKVNFQFLLNGIVMLSPFSSFFIISIAGYFGIFGTI